MARGNKRGSVHVKGYSYVRHHKRVKVPGFTKTKPGGKRGSQKKR
jgi:hypothetical protein